MESMLFTHTNFKRTILLSVIALLSLSLNAGISDRIPPIIKSIILPGWGEISQGYNRGYAQMFVDAGLWTSLFYYNEESDLFQEKAYDYAVRFAGISNTNHSEQYLVDIGKYDHSGFDVRGYNAMIVVMANHEYSTDNESRQQYIQDNIYSDDMAWEWESVQHRSKYTSYRKKSMDCDDYAGMISGLLIVNRVASCIDLLIIKQSKLKAMTSLYDYQTPMINLSFEF